MQKIRRLFKKFLPNGLMGRSLLILILPVVIIQAASIYIFFDRHWSRVSTRLAFAVASEISLITDIFEATPDEKTRRMIIEKAAQKMDLHIMYNPKAVLLGPYQKKTTTMLNRILWESAISETMERELSSLVKHPFRFDVDFDERWVNVHVQLPQGVLNFGIPQRRLFSSSGRIFLLWMGGISILLLIVAILFMRNQIRPIKRLAIAAERFGKGRDTTTFRPQGAREVRMAAQAFVDMRDRIKRQIEQRTIMLAGVSHDLRTPLTRLKLQLAMLGDGPDIKAMKGDIIEMEKMIAGYLDFVRGEGDEAMQKTEIKPFIQRIVDNAKRQGADITFIAEPWLNINIRPLAMERCLNNLIANAAKYGQHVWIDVHSQDEDILISVEDDGPGIPEDRYEEVFRPFTRLDEARSNHSGSVGLGLPIAMDVVHAHGGKIWLEKSSYGGLKVAISLPL